MHTLPFAKNPGTQKHAACPIVELLPYEHAVHAALPLVALYVPTAHDTHGPPFGPVSPVLHRQFVIDPLRAGAAEFAGHTVQFVLASGAYCPASHIRHVALLYPATVVEYVPTEHFVHSTLPSESLYVPGEQGTH